MEKKCGESGRGEVLDRQGVLAGSVEEEEAAEVSVWCGQREVF